MDLLLQPTRTSGHFGVCKNLESICSREGLQPYQDGHSPALIQLPAPSLKLSHPAYKTRASTSCWGGEKGAMHIAQAWGLGWQGRSQDRTWGGGWGWAWPGLLRRPGQGCILTRPCPGPPCLCHPESSPSPCDTRGDTHLYFTVGGTKADGG